MTHRSALDRKDARRKVAAVCRRLRAAYGPVAAPPKRPVLDVLLGTILSQNTSDTNSHAAFEELRRRFGNWEAVGRAPCRRIAAAIRRAGLSKQKAPRIKAILQQVHQQQGELALERLGSMPRGRAVEYLRSLPGVGPKTAACVLLFACGKPILPVDTHVHRVSRRLGLIGQRTDAAKAHELLARLVPAGQVLEFHLQLIRHGRRRCSARSPRCEECPLVDLCPEGMERLRGAR